MSYSRVDSGYLPFTHKASSFSWEGTKEQSQVLGAAGVSHYSFITPHVCLGGKALYFDDWMSAMAKINVQSFPYLAGERGNLSLVYGQILWYSNLEFVFLFLSKNSTLSLNLIQDLLDFNFKRLFPNYRHLLNTSLKSYKSWSTFGHYINFRW